MAGKRPHYTDGLDKVPHDPMPIDIEASKKLGEVIIEKNELHSLQITMKLSPVSLAYVRAPEFTMPSIQTNKGPRAHLDHMRVGRRKYGSKQR